MVATKLTGLSAFTPILTDIAYAVDDPGGTPISGKVTFSAIRDLLQANLTSATITGATLTGSAADSLVSMTQTWNTTGTPTAIKLNVTNTASATGSLFLDLQVGGTSKASISRTGIVTLREGTTGISLEPENGRAYVMWGNVPKISIGRFFSTSFNYYGGRAASDGGYFWSDNTNVTLGTVDLALFRDASDVLAQRRSTNAQAFRVYNTYTDASNYERGALRWNSNVLELGSFAAGTGTLRGLRVGVSGNSLGFLGATPIAQYSTTGTTTGFTAGAGTAVLDDSTFTGNTGATAYTIGDVVRALKLYGLIAA